ncbi:MAG: ribose 5-phosphate isomerase B [Clostridia bacterium]|nr:ribose 5-phosphate isomerase B [Oscillospiraceae bacterium]MBR4893519.1 ribose 5-phosphate isomerase B [Clostridia bacterium]
MKIAIGADHGAFELKEVLIPYLKDKGYEVEDCGTYDLSSVDYPDIAEKTAKKIIDKECEKGILLCGTGIGISIAANKVKGIRAALCANEYSAKMSRNHNDANILCMGARVTGVELAKSILDTFLKEEFEGGRHQVRVDKIMNIE